ncbi:hypothetical protein E2C01_011863 [Portunus trituberculatus]|uniref:Uncharacterized protein n=1 Tax=Portunus trituberculatus TaxID=210409 RepID=A0A5B7DCE5_PORTR|nr:hypothetical protein [Portunus trituberculatus]
MRYSRRCDRCKLDVRGEAKRKVAEDQFSDVLRTLQPRPARAHPSATSTHAARPLNPAPPSPLRPTLTFPLVMTPFPLPLSSLILRHRRCRPLPVQRGKKAPLAASSSDVPGERFYVKPYKLSCSRALKPWQEGKC